MHQKLRLSSALLAAALIGAPVYAQDPKLVEAGKKEGKVTVYGSLETDSAEAVFKVFRQKTGIDLDYWRASSTKVMDRALTEYRAGKSSLIGVPPSSNFQAVAAPIRACSISRCRARSSGRAGVPWVAR